MSYLPLEQYGVIGDLHTAALVGLEGSIDWLCLPRFDSPSVFAALLDDAKGGRWRIAPVSAIAQRSQRYLPGTNVLQTVHRVAGGCEIQVTDFMPVGGARGRYVEIHRAVQCFGGKVEIAIHFAPRFHYAMRRTVLRPRTNGWLATDDDVDVLTLSAPPQVSWSVEGETVEGRITLGDQERVDFVLRCDDDEVRPVAEYETRRKLAETLEWWKAWSSRLRYNGPYTDMVRRSALALKLCCYAPTGAIVAAPTTSLPEAIGGIRNWDYRYMWLRDTAFVLFALERSGYTDEVDAFSEFLKRLTRRSDGKHLQIMFGIEGARELPEFELAHFEGYRGTKPVRVGNAAATQFQLDVYGEVLETLHIRHRRNAPSEGLWASVRGLVEWTALNWREPDWSIWEVRGEARHFVFSKIMAWTALERGAQMAQQSGLGGDVAHWRREAASIREEVLVRGWDARRATFVQAYDNPELDAAVLVMPLLRFLPRNDPRVRSTLDAVRRELSAGSEDLVYRYLGNDGLPGIEGAFVLCCFWVVQVMAMTGQFAEAERLFKQLLARATPLGLYGEEIDPATGVHLGNFPQALSHAAVISTAHLLERLRPRR